MRYHLRGAYPITLNQRVQGSSPCAPTIEVQEIVEVLNLEFLDALGASRCADPQRTRQGELSVRGCPQVWKYSPRGSRFLHRNGSGVSAKPLRLATVTLP